VFEESYCLACTKRDRCHAICPALERHLKETYGTHHSVKARPFACVAKRLRVSIGAEKYGNPNALLYSKERAVADDD